jgi:hypothetical protein
MRDETRVHAEKVNGDSLTYELVFNADSIMDGRADATRMIVLMRHG